MVENERDATSTTRKAKQENKAVRRAAKGKPERSPEEIAHREARKALKALKALKQRKQKV